MTYSILLEGFEGLNLVQLFDDHRVGIAVDRNTHLTGTCWRGNCLRGRRRRRRGHFDGLFSRCLLGIVVLGQLLREHGPDYTMLIICRQALFLQLGTEVIHVRIEQICRAAGDWVLARLFGSAKKTSKIIELLKYLSNGGNLSCVNCLG